MSPIRLEITGKMAEKNGTLITLDASRQILAVDGIDPIIIKEIFIELIELIKDGLKLDISEHVTFYETIMDYQIGTDKNPRKMIENISKEIEFSTKIGSIFGYELSPFTIRLANKGKIPNSPDWMDVRIEPYVPLADKFYSITVVNRNTKREGIMSMFTSIEDILIQIVNYLES